MSKVILILHAGKIQHTTPKDFRPTSLTSFLYKSMESVLETIIKENINNTLLQQLNMHIQRKVNGFRSPFGSRNHRKITGVLRTHTCNILGHRQGFCGCFFHVQRKERGHLVDIHAASV